MIFLDCIFDSMKLKSFFISRIGSAACQTVHPHTKINVFRAVFAYREFQSQRDLKNQIPNFLIIFIMF